MDLQDVTIWFEEMSQGFILIGILLIPTILYFALQSMGYTSPFFIEQLAINTWFKGVVGITVGVLIGFAINKKWG